MSVEEKLNLARDYLHGRDNAEPNEGWPIDEFFDIDDYIDCVRSVSASALTLERSPDYEKLDAVKALTDASQPRIDISELRLMMIEVA